MVGCWQFQALQWPWHAITNVGWIDSRINIEIATLIELYYHSADWVQQYKWVSISCRHSNKSIPQVNTCKLTKVNTSITINMELKHFLYTGKK